MAVSRRLRFEVLRRDGHTCRYCGAKAPDVALTVDHVIPIALGGGDEPNNLVTACAVCNRGKSSVPGDAQMIEDVDAAAMLWAKAMERAADIRRQEILQNDALVNFVDKTWGEWSYGEDKLPIPRDENWRESIARFLSAGLSPVDMERFVRVAMGSQVVIAEKWRYFCGCCWREITERQELARRLLEDEEV